MTGGIVFTQLELRGFKRFVTPVSVPLHNLGLVLVQGENRVSNAADSNGCGKSALIADAIPWVLHNKTVRGERGDVVASRFSDDVCLGRLHVVVDGHAGTITRTARPGSLRIEGFGLPQPREAERAAAWIAAHLRWGWATYCNAAIFGQRASQFASASVDVQRKVLEEVLDLDFSAALARAKAWRTELEAAQRAQTSDAAIDAARVEELRTQVEHLRSVEQAWATEHATRLTEAREAYAAARRVLARAKTAVADATRVCTALQSEEAAVRTFERWYAAEQTLATRSVEARQVVERARRVLQNLTERVELLLKNRQCPTCLHATTGADGVALRARMQPDLDAARAAVDAATRTATGEATALAAHQATQPTPMDRLTWERAVAARERERALAAQAVTHAEGVLERADVARAACAAETCAAEADLARVTATLRAVERGQRARAVAQARRERTLAVAAYWVRAFSSQGIPNLVLESEEPTIQARLDVHVRALTRGEATVELRALERLKGTDAQGQQKVRERVNVQAAWQWGSDTLNGGSDGQDRRVHLAVFAAMQDLAELRSTRPFPVKVFDEPCDKLDALGKDIFLEWVRGQAQSRATTFFVTHDQDVAGTLRPDAVWRVILDADGAHVVCE